MADLNLDLDYFGHPKTKRLIGLLGRGAEVLPIKLWCYCGKYHAEDGKLTGYAAQEIEAIVDWWGPRGECLTAMVQVGFMEFDGDTYAVHGWSERAGHIAALRAAGQKAARSRWNRMRSHYDRNADGNAIALRSQCHDLHNQPTNQPTNDVGAAGDDLDSEIRTWIGGHRMLVYDPTSHAKLRKLVELAGWPAARAEVESALAKAVGFPIGYALTAFCAKQAQADARAGPPRDADADRRQSEEALKRAKEALKKYGGAT